MVDLDLRWSKCGSRDEFKAGISDKFPGKPQERLLEVVVGFGGDIVVLEILLPMERDRLRLDLALFDIDLVAAKDDRDVLADTDEIAMPVGDVLVRDAGRDVKHDDTALAVDVVSIAETAELLLTGGIPDVKLQLPEVRVEAKRMNLHAQSGDIFLLELSSQMTLDESGLSGTTVADEDELKGWDAAIYRPCCLS